VARRAARRDRAWPLRQQPRALQPARRQAQDEQLQRAPSRRTASPAPSANTGATYMNSIALRGVQRLCPVLVVSRRPCTKHHLKLAATDGLRCTAAAQATNTKALESRHQRRLCLQDLERPAGSFGSKAGFRHFGLAAIHLPDKQGLHRADLRVNLIEARGRLQPGCANSYAVQRTNDFVRDGATIDLSRSISRIGGDADLGQWKLPASSHHGLALVPRMVVAGVYIRAHELRCGRRGV